MSDPKDSQLQPIQIVKEFNGLLFLEEAELIQFLNLNGIISSVSGLTIISIVGPRKSGKSFLLNLILQYLKSNQDGGWINNLVKKKVPMEGFPWHDQCDFQSHESGVYIWPKVFYVENSEGIKTPVILLDAIKSSLKDDKFVTASYSSIDQLLCLISCNIVDNQIKNFKPDTLEILHNISYEFKLEKQVTFIVRDSDKPGKEEKLMESIQCVLGDGTEIRDFFDGLKSKRGCLLKTPDRRPLSDSSGFLDLDSTFVRHLKAIIGKVVDADSFPKNNLEGINILAYFNKSVDLVNGWTVSSASMKNSVPSLDLISINFPTSTGNEICTVNQEDAISMKSLDEVEVNKDVEMVDLSYILDTDLNKEIETCSRNSLLKNKALERSKVTHEDLKKFNSPVQQNDDFNRTRNESLTSYISTSTTIIVNPTINKMNSVVSSDPLNLKKDKKSAYFKDSQASRDEPPPLPTSPPPSEDPVAGTLDRSSMASGGITFQRQMDKGTLRILKSGDSKTSPVGITSLQSKDGIMISNAGITPEQKKNPKGITANTKVGTKTSTTASDVKISHLNQNASLSILPHELDEIIQQKVRCLLQNYEEKINFELLEEANIKSIHENPSKSYESEFRNFLLEEIKIPMPDLFKVFQKSLNRIYEKVNKKRQQQYSTNDFKGESVDGAWSKEVEDNPNKSEKVPIKSKDSTCNLKLEEQSDQDQPMDTHDEMTQSLPAGVAYFSYHKLKFLLESCQNFTDSRLINLFTSTESSVQQAHEESKKAFWNEVNNLSKKENLILTDEIRQTAENDLQTQLETFLFNVRGAQMYLETSYETFLKKLECMGNRLIDSLANFNLQKRDNAATLFRVILKEHMRSVDLSPNQKKQCQDELESKSKGVLLSMINLEEALESYLFEMQRNFDMYRCLSDAKFKEFDDKYTKISAEKLKPNSHLEYFIGLFDSGIKKLKDQFKTRNVLTMEYEDQAALQVIVWVKNFYNDMMKELTDNKLISHSNLQLLHQDVVREAIEAFVKACNFNPSSGMDDQVYRQAILTELNPLFQNYKNSNDLRVQKLNLNINKAIIEHKKVYNERMEVLLPRKGSSYLESDFKKKHESILDEVCTLLKMDIRNIDASQSSESHISVLKHKIQGDWECFQTLNKKKFQEEQQKSLEIEREKKRKEAEQKLREEEFQQKKKREASVSKQEANTASDRKSFENIPAITSEESSPSAIPTSTNKKKFEKCTDPDLRVELPPIAIEFGIRSISVGWINNEKFELIRNVWGDSEFPSMIALTNEKEILIGHEVSHRKKFDLKFQYSMENFFIESKRGDIAYSCDIDDRQDAGKEFFMALLLTRIKMDVEKLLNGRWSSVVITVPLWYTSVQRQATRDAAQIGGFFPIFLVNETSAAALSFAKDGDARWDNKRGNCVLVSVCSDHHFDAAVYEYKMGKIKMETSLGDMHLPNAQAGFISNAIKAGKNFLTGSKEKTQLEEAFKSVVGEYKSDIKEHFIVNIGKPNNPCLEKMSSLVSQYGREYKNSENSIISGAAIFASCIHKSFQTIDIIQDRTTFSFCRKVIGDGSKSKNVFDPKHALFSDLIKSLEHTISIKNWVVDQAIKYFENSSTNEQNIGKLIIQIPSKDIREVQIKGFLNNEGIFSAEAYLSKGKCQSNINLQFHWKSENLDEAEKNKLITLIQTLKKDEKKEAFENGINFLNTLIENIKPQLYSVKSHIGKTMLQKGIDEAIAIIDHPKSTLEMVEAKINTLTALKSKYNLN